MILCSIHYDINSSFYCLGQYKFFSDVINFLFSCTMRDELLLTCEDAILGRIACT